MYSEVYLTEIEIMPPDKKPSKKKLVQQGIIKAAKEEADKDKKDESQSQPQQQQQPPTTTASKKDQKQSQGKPKIIKVYDYESHFHFSVFSQWPEKRLQLEEAPEILILFKRPHGSGFTRENIMLKLLTCFGTICQNRVHSYYGLANFKPLIERTSHTIDYILALETNYSKIAPPSPNESLSSQRTTSTIASASTVKASENKKGQAKEKVKEKTKDKSGKGKDIPQKLGQKHYLLKEFYQTAHNALLHLQNGITLYKQIILSLSFTRYAEHKLEPAEIKLTRGKTIIGSCMWVITYVLQQLPEDPDIFMADPVMKKKQLEPLLVDLAAELQDLISWGFHAWSSMVRAIGVLERVHRKTEDLFHKQTHYFHKSAPPDSEHAIATSVHLKRYRRSEHDAIKLRKFDPPREPVPWFKKHSFPRVLYKANYAKPDAAWKGFDPLGIKDKFKLLKDLINFVRLILKSVEESADKIVVELQGPQGHRRASGASLLNAVNHPSHHQHHHHHLQVGPKKEEMVCYEDGIEIMDELLSKKLARIDWTANEIFEFFEIDKIFLDDIDLLTLGAGVTRAILHDARHTLHICYETSRLIEFKEFTNLPDYQKVHKRIKEAALAAQHKQQKSHKNLPNANANEIELSAEKYINSAYDIEELQLELRNASALFRSSAYYDVVKELPIYTSQVGITLQDADLVFTPSSEKLLSKPRITLM